MKKVVKTKYKEEDHGVYSPISTEQLDNETLDHFMKNPDKWEEMGVFSQTEMYELEITDMGREHRYT